ncbi:MAG TPA: glycoside hydrolase family 2 TIM barrel-domain containing protein [Gemmatimonadales bacterium]|nr:glycoside hydrolase family 2 TIM barrel-domain containing protein [Gemmatimonadales bacterium]
MIRRRTHLDGRWEFFPDPDRSLAHDTLDGAPAREIRVPGPWQAQFDDLRHYTGTAWYRLRFTVDRTAVPREAVFIIHFGAVDYHARVWLNGTLLGEHEGGYLPFELELGEALRPEATNELIVRVIDPGDDAEAHPEFPFAEIPHGKQSWYGPVGGIWQSVHVEARHPVHLVRLKVTPDLPAAQVRVEVGLNRPLPQPANLRLTVVDPAGGREEHRFDMTGTAFDTVLPILDPMPWDTDTPNLYELEAALADDSGGENAVDVLSTTFGMRSITTSPSGHLLLNGKVLYLRGALDQDYYPELIYTPFSDDELDSQFVKARHMGLNCLRTHIKITDPRYYDAADRAGLLIWTELPNWQDLTDAAKRRAEETLFGMVERDWNHPSIIIWTIANENWGLDLAVNAGHRAWLAEVYARLKAADPHRLVVGNSPCFTNFHVVTDIEDFHNYYAMPDHYRAWRDWVQTFASRPPWTFAHVYESFGAWRDYVRDPWNPAPREQAPEVRRQGSEPMVVSEFGNWGLPDVSRLRACYGGSEPWWFETGIEWGDGVVYPHGVEQRYRAYHIDRAFPTLSDLSAASQRMQFTALKYQIEQMRRHPSIVGYVITEFTDVHWESNGLLDMCRNPKAYFDVIRDINGADALIPVDWERIAYWAGERCEVKLALSHFSPHDLRECRVEWSLDAFPDVQGVIGGVSPLRAQLTSMGTAVFEVPAVSSSVRARLEMRLVDAAGRIVTHNHHELYFFPRFRADGMRLAVPGLPRLASRLSAMGYDVSDRVEEDDLVVVETMTDEMRWHAQNGGRVLWLAESSDSHQAHLGNMGIAQRHGRAWQGDWASSMSWLRQDRIFKDIPTGGTVDFAFADLTPEAVIVGLTPRDFASQVYAGLFVGWVHQVVALVAERGVDRGRIMACTFRLREHLGVHPVATVMVRDMITRLARPIHPHGGVASGPPGSKNA